jgi:hypothetical protein
MIINLDINLDAWPHDDAIRSNLDITIYRDGKPIAIYGEVPPYIGPQLSESMDEAVITPLLQQCAAAIRDQVQVLVRAMEGTET